MVLRQFIVFFACLIVLVLLGAGCKSDKTQATPSEPEQEAEEAQADAGQKGEAEAEAESETGVRADSGVSKPELDAGADASAIPEGWQVHRQGSVSFQYPENWEVVEYKDDPERIGLVAPDNPSDPGHEPLPEISITVRANPEQLRPRSFYRQQGESIFEEASRVRSVNVAGRDGYFLDDIAGGITIDLTVLAFDRWIVEFELTREDYQDLSRTVIESFRLDGGAP